MTAALLSIGTELTRGELINSNAQWLAQELTAMGIEVLSVEAVPDDTRCIEQALMRAARSHSVLICTGGLGPTSDDMTAQSVAAAMGVPLERDTSSLAAISARMERQGRPMAASNAKQADFPKGSSVLPNALGTAPGFCIQILRALAFFLPGVPREMRAMFEAEVEPRLPSQGRQAWHQTIVRSFGMPESRINDALIDLEGEFAVSLGYRAHFPDIEVKVLARGDHAKSRADAAASEVERRLGLAAYGRGHQSLPEVVSAELRGRGVSLAVAESCTGGLVTEQLTRHAGASEFLLGGAVTYADSVKTALLGVPSALLETAGAVSREVAVAMAEGARRVFSADYALSITGVAGPGGGSAAKPVGLVHFAVAAAGGTVAGWFLQPGTRDRVRWYAAFSALSLLRAQLRGS